MIGMKYLTGNLTVFLTSSMGTSTPKTPQNLRYYRATFETACVK